MANDPFDELVRQLRKQVRNIDPETVRKLKNRSDLNTEQLVNDAIRRLKREYGIDLGDPAVRSRLTRQLRRLGEELRKELDKT